MPLPLASLGPCGINPRADGSARTPNTGPGMSIRVPALGDFRRIVVKVGSSLLVDREGGRLNDAWLVVAGRRHRLAARRRPRRAGGVVGRDRARPLRAQAAARARSSSKTSQAAAAVGQIALARTWSEVLGRHGITAGQVLVTLQRHRGAAALSQRPLDHRQAARMARRAGDQRERHRRHQRDPLRRQRPPRRARRHHGERRPAGAAVRHRRPLRRAARHRAATPSSCRWSSASRRRSRRWRARPAPSSRAAACRPRSRPARSPPPAAPTW